MASASVMLVLLASRATTIAGLSHPTPAVDGTQFSAFDDQDEGQGTLSLLQVHKGMITVEQPVLATTAEADENPVVVISRVDASEANRAATTVQHGGSWRPNTDSDPRSKWGKPDDAGVDTRYSRLNPDNGGAPERPESYEALGPDADGEERAAEDEDQFAGGGQEPNMEDDYERAKGGGLFAPSEPDERVHGNRTHKQSGEREHATAESRKQADIRETFDAFNVDGSSAMDHAEMRAAMKALGFAPHWRQLNKMIADIDANGNGAVEYSEFLQMVLDHHLMTSP